MSQVLWTKLLKLSLFLCVLSIANSCIIVPLKWDNPAQENVEKVALLETTKSEIHKLLGTPMVSSDKFNAEVFVVSGGEVKAFWASMFTAPIAWPTPWAGVESEDLTGYILAVYEGDIVKEIDYGSDQGDLVIDAGGFTYYVGLHVLMSPVGFFENSPQVGPETEVTQIDQCSIFILPNSRETIYLDSQPLVSGMGSTPCFYRQKVEIGEHIVSTYYTNFKRHNIVEKHQVKLTCKGKEQFFIQVLEEDSNWTNKILSIAKTKTPPSDMFSRREILWILPTIEQGLDLKLP